MVGMDLSATVVSVILTSRTADLSRTKEPHHAHSAERPRAEKSRCVSHHPGPLRKHRAFSDRREACGQGGQGFQEAFHL